MPLLTPDGRYLVVRQRLWRAANPALTVTQRDCASRALMSARRAVRDAHKNGDQAAEKRARKDVHSAKVALGERGEVWWTDGSPDVNRRMIQNTEYAGWWETVVAIRDTIVVLLEERAANASICPSDVARALMADGWRNLMPLVRDVAREMAKEGLVEITQKGKRLSNDGEWRGPIRIVRGSVG